ncbi:alpha/beta hydrolase [Consotaella salsifontis]|uniref:Acetyl esterase/lipase n=1 Tax=Consotaella salsifontis TaxID=1365950 RepID=A0A1T4SWV7_9HYPH|nr:alpha/beta hydrolase [Consotaella salsifontis]SKA32636.1 Acetyl esterase/lipase [Consotaella salsifontis]
MLSRRSFLVAAAAAAFTRPAWAGDAVEKNDVIAMWPGDAPGGGGPIDKSERLINGAVSNISSPAMEVIRPAHPNGAAMLVLGGGGYREISMDNEAMPAARWLAAKGITAFVLHYRLPGEGWSAGGFAPLQDAQRAVRLIRANAAAYGIDTNRIGVLGFSAGGHLAGLVATRADEPTYDPIDKADYLSARPATAALIYPVITLRLPYDTTSTYSIFVGKKPDPAKSAEWSIDSHVEKDCPPVFLVQTADDPICSVQNCVLMQQACQRVGVPVELHSLPSGGHGFGMGKPGSPSAEWPKWYGSWLTKFGTAA